MAELTPMQVEKRLLELGHELDDAQTELNAAELEFHEAKAAAEIGEAKTLLEVGKQTAESGSKMNAAEKSAWATVKSEPLILRLAVAEARVKAARGNVARIRVHVDIARSLGTSVRESMKL